MELVGERWYLQYSPYRYYNEHCIVLSDEHRPMRTTAARSNGWRVHGDVPALSDRLQRGPADSGGLILSHDHFQGGCFEFPMDRARRLWTQQRGDSRSAFWTGHFR